MKGLLNNNGFVKEVDLGNNEPPMEFVWYDVEETINTKIISGMPELPESFNTKFDIYRLQTVMTIPLPSKNEWLVEKIAVYNINK